MAGLWFCFSVALSLAAFSSCTETLVGAPENIDPNIPAVQNAATFAMNAYNEKSKDEYIGKVLQVVSAKAQVVAGVIYTMEVKVGRTQCKKGSTANADSCALMLTPGLRQNTENLPPIFRRDRKRAEEAVGEPGGAATDEGSYLNCPI